MIVFDVTDMVSINLLFLFVYLFVKYNVHYYSQDSFEHTKTWLNEVDRYASADVSKILVGNRCHLVEKKVVDFTTARAQVKYTLCMCASIYQCISFTNIFFHTF